MYIDLGSGNFVSIDSIVAIIDSQSAIEDVSNHQLILGYQKDKGITNCSKKGYIKSYVLTENKDGKKIYGSGFSTSRLKNTLVSLE